MAVVDAMPKTLVTETKHTGDAFDI